MLDVFDTLSAITLDNYKPKIFCGITLTTAADTTPDQKAGKFELIQLTNPDGTPQINPSTGKQAFRYIGTSNNFFSPMLPPATAAKEQ